MCKSLAKKLRALEQGQLAVLDNYPICKFVAWARPILEKCPECDSPYLVEKHLKSGSWAACPNKECKYKHEIARPEETVVKA